MPVTVLQQDWGAELATTRRRCGGAWTPDLDHQTVSCGHVMAEEAPTEALRALRALLAR